MKVSEGTFLVEGALRTALYCSHRQQAVPINSTRLIVLRAIANGVRPSPNTLSLTRRDINESLYWLLAQGAISRAPRTKSCLDPPLRQDNGNKPNQFSHVWLELTNSCNLSCQHCYANSSPASDRTGELTSDQWTALCRQLIEHGVSQFTFIGGEPLVRKLVLRQVSEELRRISPGLKLRVFSNLTIFPQSEDWLSFFESMKFSFGTSIYGTTAEAHDAVTRQPGSWEKTTQNIRLLRARRLPVFAGYYATTTLSEDERKVVEKFLSVDLGLEDFTIDKPSVVGRAQSMSLSSSETKNILPNIKRMSHATDLAMSGMHNCFADVLAIRPNGSVIPCIMQRDTELANLAEQPLKSLWQNNNYRRYRQLSKDHIDGCRECEFRYACFDCRPAAIAGGTNLVAKPACGYDPRLELGSNLSENHASFESVIVIDSIKTPGR